GGGEKRFRAGVGGGGGGFGGGGDGRGTSSGSPQAGAGDAQAHPEGIRAPRDARPGPTAHDPAPTLGCGSRPLQSIERVGGPRPFRAGPRRTRTEEGRRRGRGESGKGSAGGGRD
ncbi:hypothetical protein Naga_100229g10, partial [Nannochloropsis gaditana]